jgi:hypothetical protein
LLAAALEAAAEAAAITANTKAQLLVQAATMTQAGSTVQVSGGSTTSTSSSAQSVLQEVMSGAEQVAQVAQPLLSAAQQVGAGPVQRPTATPILAPAKFDSLAGAGAVLAAAGFGAGGGFGAPGAAGSLPLEAWQEDNLTEAAAAEPTGETIASASAVSESAAMPPMVTGGGALSAFRASASTSTPEALVNARHTDELIGDDPDDIAAPVIGAIPTSPTSPDTPFSL